jgi:hypothetical protein
MTIERRQARACVDDQQRDIGLIERALRLCPHTAAKRFGRRLLEPGGVDQTKCEIGDMTVGFAAVARDPRRVVDKRQRPPRQPVEQRRFADIRPPDDRDRETHCRLPLRAEDQR